MEKIIWSDSSKASLRAIWVFYAESSEQAADRIIQEIIQAAEGIRFGEEYQIEELLGEDYRRVIVRHFKIIYRLEKKTLRILDVFDARQNPEKLGGDWS